MAHPSIQTYFNSIKDRYKLGNATEHTYRGDLQLLLEALGDNIKITNEPRRQECGAPDYIATRKEIPIGFIEAKDIDDTLDKTEKGEQLKRYKESLDNLILTDYLEFRLYRFGNKVSVIRIAEVADGKIVALKGNWPAFHDIITEFYAFKGTTITSADKLAKMMAAKAKMMHEVIEKALTADLQLDPYQQSDEDTSLKQQYQAFKEVLIHDIKPGEFADIYAQTIAYGMFAARLNDTTLEDFSRKEAAELVPKSNPFLRKLFQYIAGYDLDTRLDWIVDALAEVFAATDVKELLKDFGISTQTTDPIIHFYETFLGEYNPALRKSRGVYYTPQPIVNFIVRAVDDILKEEFGLPQGLADTSKIKIKVDVPGKKDKVEKEVHKVQILDPACGTGTFLAEVIRQIYNKFEGQQGVWNDYVEQHLIPRVNGFEILMASYAMCHLKLELLLRETGYKPYEPKRLRVYLTNSLEEAGENKRDLFTQWLTDESLQANIVKKDTPVMVVIGNPPYSGHSSNNGKWIEKLIADYKQEPGGGKLQEKNSKWLNDDYVKFIRYGQHFIEKNGEGVLAFINNHSFLNNPTFRGMRWHLLTTFDKIYIIDLHGNAKKKEVCPDGSPDQNVFDIQQGVSINLFIKTRYKQQQVFGKVLHYDLFGERNLKYSLLSTSTLQTIDFQELNTKYPYLAFVKSDSQNLPKYNLGFRIDEMFPQYSLGVLTKKDKFITDFSPNDIRQRLIEVMDQAVSDEQLATKYNLKLKDNDNWDLKTSRAKLFNNGIDDNLINTYAYRCFDNRYIYYQGDFVARLNTRVMSNFQPNHLNFGLITTRQLAVSDFSHVFLTTIKSDQCYISNRTKEGCYVFPLFLNNKKDSQLEFDNLSQLNPNLNNEMVVSFAKGVGLDFTNELKSDSNTFSPLSLLDYIYSVLHSPTYREIYKEFLKIDFPRIPYPTDKEVFWKLVALGGELRQLHLLESPKVNQFITSYPEAGDNEVTKVTFDGNDTGKVWINTTQYFDKVPKIAWEFYIGGYQPAQKWLKDRKGRKLSFEDIMHYQRVIVALTETARIMVEIDHVFKF